MTVTRSAPKPPPSARVQPVQRPNANSASKKAGKQSQLDGTSDDAFLDDLIDASGKGKGKAKGKRKKNGKKQKTASKSFVDLLSGILFIWFTIYSFTVCPDDADLQRPLCRALHSYRIHILEPYILPPIQAALAHPSVAPTVQRIQPYAERAIAVATPVVVRSRQEWNQRVVPQWNRRVVPEWNKRVVPQLMQLDQSIQPYRLRVEQEYEKRFGPHVRLATRNIQRWQRKAQPFVILAANKTHEGYLKAKPYAGPAWERFKLLVLQVFAFLAEQRRLYVDPQVARMWAQIKESSTGKQAAKTVSDVKVTASQVSSRAVKSASVTAQQVSSAVSSAAGQASSSASSIVSDISSSASSVSSSVSLSSRRSAISSSSSVVASSGLSQVSSLASAATSSIVKPVSSVIASGASSATLAAVSASSSIGSVHSSVPVSSSIEGTATSVLSAVSDAYESASSILSVPSSDASSSLVSVSSVAGAKASTLASNASSKFAPAASSLSSSIASGTSAVYSTIASAASSSSSVASSIAEAAGSSVSVAASSISLAASSPTPQIIEDNVDGDDDFLRDLGLSPDLSEPEPPAPIETVHEESMEEKIERLRLEEEQKEAKKREVAEKRAGIMARHTVWEEKIDGLIKEKKKSLRRSLVSIRKAAAAQFKESPEVRAEVEGLTAEAEKLLKGAEGFLNNLKNDKRSPEDKTKQWGRVCEKVGDKFTSRLNGTEQLVNGWYRSVLVREEQEVNLATTEVRELADRSQEEIGIEYVWLEDVTYMDWQRYHALAGRSANFTTLAFQIQNGSHPSPPANAVLEAVDELEEEVDDIVKGFETRLRQIKRDGERTLSGEVIEDAATAQKEADEPTFSVSPIPGTGNEPKDAAGAAAPIALGRGQQEVLEALGRAAGNTETDKNTPRSVDASEPPSVEDLAEHAETGARVISSQVTHAEL